MKRKINHFHVRGQVIRKPIDKVDNVENFIAAKLYICLDLFNKVSSFIHSLTLFYRKQAVINVLKSHQSAKYLL